MKKLLLIIGFGSAGRRFANLSKKYFKNLDLIIFTKQKNIGYKTISSISELKKINPHFIIICSPTSFHYEHLKKINLIYKNKRILIEKPLFHKFKNLTKLNNKVFVGYNLRSLKIIKYIKFIFLKNRKKIHDIYFINHSYLPMWRNNIHYQKSSSAKKKYGGGVILDCSHEIDLAQWIIGKTDILCVLSSKKSGLKIDTEDNCKVFGKKKNLNLIIDLNYYSVHKKRKIYLLGNNIKIIADLVTLKVIILKKNKKIIKNFDKQSIKNSYLSELKNFVNKRDKALTKYKSALLTQKLIQKIQNFKYA